MDFTIATEIAQQFTFAIDGPHPSTAIASKVEDTTHQETFMLTGTHVRHDIHCLIFVT
ncbi:hypothetical protein D3C73_1544100 [compost metagenome]